MRESQMRHVGAALVATVVTVATGVIATSSVSSAVVIKTFRVNTTADATDSHPSSGPCAASAPAQRVVIAAKARVSLAAMRLTGGVATSANGGALLNQGATTLTNVMVDHNLAPSGGGISNVKGASLSLVKSSVVSNQLASVANSATGGSGGGILNAGRLTISHSAISSNAAGLGGYGTTDPGGHGGNGGGVDNTGTLTVAFSAFA